MTGLEPATSCSPSTRATDCATSRSPPRRRSAAAGRPCNHHKHHVPGRPHHRPTGQEQGRRGPCSRRARGSNPRGTLAPATAFEANTLPLGQPSSARSRLARAGRKARSAERRAEDARFELACPVRDLGLASRCIGPLCQPSMPRCAGDPCIASYPSPDLNRDVPTGTPAPQAGASAIPPDGQVPGRCDPPGWRRPVSSGGSLIARHLRGQHACGVRPHPGAGWRRPSPPQG